MFQSQQLLGTMDNITVSKKLLRCCTWVFLGTLFLQTVVSADTCVQTPCDNGHCCDKSGSSSASEKPCCCSRPPGGGFSITCSSHTSFRFAWYWIVLIIGVVGVIVGVVAFLIYRRRRGASDPL